MRGRTIDRQDLVYLGMILPALIIVIVYRGIPIIYNIYISFFERGLVEDTFVGLDHYYRMFNDPVFWDSLWNTILFLGTIPIGIIIALGLALLLDKQFPGNTLYRSIFFLPYITMMVAIGVVWSFMYQTEEGVINILLRTFGIIDTPINWLGDGFWARVSVFITHVWKTVGFYLIVILAGLQTIPNSLYEVAKLDNTNRWQRFRYITLPLLKPTIGVCALIGVVSTFQLFDLIIVMTDGGPGTSTEILITYLYKQAFRFGNIGYGAALSVVLFLFTVVLVLLVSPREGY